MDLPRIRQDFISFGLPSTVVGELIESYDETKRRFFLDDHRPQAVEGGRFSEAAFRLLQDQLGLAMTPVGKTLPTVDTLLVQLENRQGPDSLRLHIPRTLKLIYDIRNKRDAAHLADGIDPNLQDATLVVANMDWVLAEMVRMWSGIPASEAQLLIENIVHREVPSIQEIDGHPVILKDLKPREQTLLLLYRAGSAGIDLNELASQLRVTRKDHLKQRVARLDAERLALIHPQTGRIYLTASGQKHVETAKLAHPSHR